MEKVVVRNAAAIGYEIEFCRKRVQEVDRDNAMLVIQGKDLADEVVQFQFDDKRE